jgi:hypothetical protein
MRSPLRHFNPPQQVILIQPLAATKPPMGAPCNGCGLCCLVEPCPLGVVLSRSRTGPCKALQWVQAERQYRCGALPALSTQSLLGRLKARLVLRWIGAGAGCDCDLEPGPCATIKPQGSNDSDAP